MYNLVKHTIDVSNNKYCFGLILFKFRGIMQLFLLMDKQAVAKHLQWKDINTRLSLKVNLLKLNLRPVKTRVSSLDQ